MSVIGKPRDERGAVAPFVAVLIVFLVGLASFAVDLGYQRVAARDMQAVADIVAMDMARQLDGTKGNVLKNTDRWKDAVRASLARNDDQTVGDSLTAVPCGESLSTLPNDQSVVCATPGIYNPATGDFTLGGNQPATHVRVVTRTRVDYFFPVFADDGWVTKVAYAQADAGACFSAGSYAAKVRLGDGWILGPLLKALGTDVGLDVLGAQGLAAADIKLIDLVGTDLGVGGFEELLTTNVTLGDLYLAMADVLEAEGGQAAQVSLLRSLATVALSSASIQLGEIVDLDTRNSAGLDATLNVFDLVSAAAFVANGENAISVPSLNVGIPGVSSLSAKVKIGQKPILRCGRPKQTRGETSQVEVALEGNLVNLDLGLVSIKAPVRLSVKLAPADVELDAVACLNPQKRLDFLVTSGLLNIDVWVGDPTRDNQLAVKALLGLVTLVNGHVRFYSTPDPKHVESKSAVVDMDDYDAAPPATFGSGTIGVPHLHTDSSLNVLGILPVGGILNVVLNPLLTIVVNPLVQVLDDLLIAPLLGALGLNVAGAEVYARPRADCGVPALRG